MRALGGYIGHDPASTRAAAPGVWSLRDQCRLEAVAKWPKTGGDPYYSSVLLLLNMDGVNGSTTFTDRSPAPKSVSSNGGALVSTAQSKFGNASAYFEVLGRYLSASNAALSLAGHSAFTVEGWFYFANASANDVQIMFNNYNTFTSGGLFFGKHTVNSGRVTVYAASNPVCSELSYPPSNEWVHYALVFESNTIRVYRNGAQTAFGAVSPTYTGNLINIGGSAESSGTFRFRGYIDEFRLTSVSRYPNGTSFTPPTAAFPDY